MNYCSIKGCQDSKVWGLVKDGRLHRLSFSFAVITHIKAILQDEAYGIRRFKIVGPRRYLGLSEESRSGLYAIVDTRRDFILRIELDKRAAVLKTDYSDERGRRQWRMMAEVWLEPCRAESRKRGTVAGKP